MKRMKIIGCDSAYYDEVVVKYIHKVASRVQALQNGEIDMLYGNVLISYDESSGQIETFLAHQFPDLTGAYQRSVYSFKNFHDAIMGYKKWVVEYTMSLRAPMTCFTVCINEIFAFLIPAGILLIASAANHNAFLLDFIFYVLFTPYCTVMMTRILFLVKTQC
ncbi:hypothetical protein EV214_1467 [Marinisporobacter balticus]|uniref:Uncharacterized protein n=1 Tax=Marinisporobacter balticus TaxID=2018667 RepID=A0A4V2S9K7_9FIRM|nr:hypothetical protein EV214_1467 [Marinisporobacter balticus]